METYDVIVIGGGPAGLSAATALARSRRRVLVLDHGRPRNAAAGHLHNFLSRDGTAPGELLAHGREEVRRFGGVVEAADVVEVRRDPEGFTVTTADGRTVSALRLVVTTGLEDRLLDLPGVAERWGRDVLHCPYCHGYEVADQRVALLGLGPLVAHAAPLWRQLTDRVTVLTHDDPAPEGEEAQRLRALGVEVVTGPVQGLVVEQDRLVGVRLVSGPVVAVDAVVVAPVGRARAAFLDDLGLRTVDVEMGGRVVATRLEADPTGRTPVPGVWAAGSVVEPMAQLMPSAAAGLMAGAQVNADLVETGLRAALDARSTGSSTVTAAV